MITIKGRATTYRGYGLLFCNLCQLMIDEGVDINVMPITIEDDDASLPRKLRRAIDYSGVGPSLVVDTPDSVTSGEVLFTMWEAGKLPLAYVNGLNSRQLILVPTEWCKKVFINSGVTSAIEVVPLFIDDLVYHFKEKENLDKVLFGCGGRIDGGGGRKNIGLVISAFEEEFQTETDVVLRVKVWDKEMPVEVSKHNQVDFTRGYMSPYQMAEWYQTLDAYVCSSSGEGWGLMNHEAMSVGRPLATVNHGGVTEYFTEAAGYSIPYTMEPSTGYYESLGNWPVPTKSGLRNVMRRIYENREEARKKGVTASLMMSFYSGLVTLDRIVMALEKHGVADLRNRNFCSMC